MVKNFFLGIAGATAIAGAAAAADFGSEFNSLEVDANVENALAIAIDDSRAYAGVVSLCGVKADQARISLDAENVLAIAIDGSEAAAGSVLVGDGRCME